MSNQLNQHSKLKPLFLVMLTLPVLSSGISRAQKPVSKAKATKSSIVVVSLEQQVQSHFGSTVPPLSALIMADRHQVPSAAGLTFQIDLFNQGEEGYRADFLLDTLRLSLYDEGRRKYCSLPEVPSRLVPSGQQATSVREIRKLITPYKILSFKIDGRELNKKEIYEGYETVLPPHSHLILWLAIDRVLAHDDASTIPSQDHHEKEVPLPSGYYRIAPTLQVMGSLFSPTEAWYGSIRSRAYFDNREIEKQIVVNYGQTAEREIP